MQPLIACCPNVASNPDVTGQRARFGSLAQTCGKLCLTLGVAQQVATNERGPEHYLAARPASSLLYAAGVF